ncbi:glutathione S-transferase C-terminal domain-containing protein [Streptomyces sp. NPDC046853]|uniref:glutathione S-transferase C-terminal domain-containing protein n=1 Tax=Streptomyces sp. NPDC046853 TaxID=3154920 RepID=UPI0033F97CA8
MPEITSQRPRHVVLEEPRSPHGTRPAPIRSRIGADLAGGFYPAPHRYHLYLSAGCPHSLRVSITLDLLGLRDSVATTLLAPDAPESSAALDALHRCYEATEHHFDGPLTVPALCDRWSGHVVSNHTPDILRDLTCRLAAHGSGPLHPLRPPSQAARIDSWHDLLAGPLTPATLDRLDSRLAAHLYLAGDELSAADVDVWAKLVHPAPDEVGAEPTHAYPHLRAYVRRLHDHPAFRTHHPRTVAPDRRWSDAPA